MAKLTNEQAEAMLAALTEHFGQPVMPIDRYCSGMRQYQEALSEKAARIKEELYPGITADYYHHPELKAQAEKAYEEYAAEKKLPLTGHNLTKREYRILDLRHAEQEAFRVGDVFMQISKSNLLARLLYNGEKLRTKMCPEHKGVWSGIEWSENVCPHKCQLTGWIQEEDDQGKPLPGVQVVKLVSTGIPGETVMIKDTTGEVLGKATSILPGTVEKNEQECEGEGGLWTGKKRQN